MAKDNNSVKPETVEVPAAEMRKLLARLDQLEERDRIRQEALTRPTLLIDQEYEALKVEMGLPAQVRTQKAGDKLYGTAAPRWRCRLDSTTMEGKPGPNVSEWPEVIISANSPEEAESRYLKLCQITRHDYKVSTVALPPDTIPVGVPA